jgi:hypothetical protein
MPIQRRLSHARAEIPTSTCWPLLIAQQRLCLKLACTYTPVSGMERNGEDRTMGASCHVGSNGAWASLDHHQDTSCTLTRIVTHRTAHGCRLITWPQIPQDGISGCSEPLHNGSQPRTPTVGANRLQSHKISKQLPRIPVQCELVGFTRQQFRKGCCEGL